MNCEEDFTGRNEPRADPNRIELPPVVLKYDAAHLYDSIIRQAADTVTERAGSDIRQSVAAQVQETIGARVGALIDATIEAGIQPRNTYGEPIGEPTTLKAMIGGVGEKYLAEKVNKDGNTGYHADRTRLEWLVAKAVEQHIDYRLKTEIEKAVKAATEAAAARVGEVAGAMLMKLAK